jgi:hypothetical protein
VTDNRRDVPRTRRRHPGGGVMGAARDGRRAAGEVVDQDEQGANPPAGWPTDDEQPKSLQVTHTPRGRSAGDATSRVPMIVVQVRRFPKGRRILFGSMGTKSSAPAASGFRRPVETSASSPAPEGWRWLPMTAGCFRRLRYWPGRLKNAAGRLMTTSAAGTATAPWRGHR